MPRRPATVIQADIARTIRAAKQAGAVEVEVRVIKGETSILVRFVSSTPPEKSLEPTAEIIL